MKRVFVAIKIELDPGFIQIIDTLKKGLEEEPVKWVNRRNFHLTLHFIGNIDEQQEACLMDLFQSFAASEEVFGFTLGGIHFFKKGRHPRVLYIDVTEEDAGELEMVAERLKKVLQEKGFVKPDDMAFRAHLTIARLNVLKNKDRFYELLKQAEVQGLQQKVRASEMIFYESVTKPEGPVYTPLATFKFMD